MSKLIAEHPTIKEIKQIAARAVSTTEAIRLEGYRKEIWKQVRILELRHCVSMFRRDVGEHIEQRHAAEQSMDFAEELRELRRKYTDVLEVKHSPRDMAVHINSERKRCVSELKPLAHKATLEILAERWRKERENHETKEDE